MMGLQRGKEVGQLLNEEKITDLKQCIVDVGNVSKIAKNVGFSNTKLTLWLKGINELKEEEVFNVAKIMRFV